MGRKRWSASEKFRIALIAHKGEETIEEICRRYKVAASQVHAWKKRLISEGPEGFGKSKESNAGVHLRKEMLALYEKIGQLTVGGDYLKKAWGSVHERNDCK